MAQTFQEGMDAMRAKVAQKKADGDPYLNNPSFATAPVNNPKPAQPVTQQAQQPSFDMNAFNASLGDMFSGFANTFNNQFSQMQSMYDGRMASLEKLLADMNNKNQYNAVQRQQPEYTTPGAPSGSHIFDAPKDANAQGNPVGYTQGENAMNEALFKYLNKNWNGGF